MLDPKLLGILACPACQGNLQEKDNKLVCAACGKKYPIQDGIPILMADEAE